MTLANLKDAAKKAPENEYCQDYALTVTVSAFVKQQKAELQLSATAMLLVQLLQPSKMTIVAELTKNFDVHYHCTVAPRRASVVKVKNMCKYFVDKFRGIKHFGFICVKPVQDYKGWMDYMKKDLVTTRDLIKMNPVIKDDYSEFKEWTYDNGWSYILGGVLKGDSPQETPTLLLQ